MNLRLLLILQFFSVAALAGKPPSAEELIPFDEMGTNECAMVRAVTGHVTMRRDYPRREITGRMEHMDFLTREIEACSILAQKIKLVTYRATTDKQGRVVADDMKGSKGFMTLVYAGKGTRVFHIKGEHKAGLYSASGRGVAVLDYAPAPGREGVLEYKATVFVRVDNPVLATLAKAFAAFLKGAVDKNFRHVMKGPVSLTERARESPGKLREAIETMPAEDREKLNEFEKLLK